jgi:hypothetical protein
LNKTYLKTIEIITGVCGVKLANLISDDLVNSESGRWVASRGSANNQPASEDQPYFDTLRPVKPISDHRHLFVDRLGTVTPNLFVI